MMHEPAILDIREVSLRRREVVILDRVSWTIEPGQHWALIGANGSGKTTLLKVITGYEWPSAGEVAVLGKTFGQCHLPTLRKRLGWVSSALVHRFCEGNTARDVVLSGLEASIGLYRDYSPAEHTLAERALDHLSIGHLADRLYGWLSQGEQQRVLIARALVHEPPLLILDEPCAGLDPAARAGFLADVARLSRRTPAPAILLVTHHLEEVHGFISHVLVLKAGRVLAGGPKAQVLTEATLSEAFGTACRLHRTGGLYGLDCDPPTAS